MRNRRAWAGLILIAGLTVGAVQLLVKGYSKMAGYHKEVEFKVGFPFSTELSQFDPARVQVAGQYALLENLYTPLLQQDNQGRIIPGVAKEFYWVGDEIEFQIRDDLIDSGGTPITVEDVYFSLMRLLVLGTSTHGDLQKLICPDHAPLTVDDTCSGIRIIDGKLRLKPTTKNYSIFKNFTSIDFAVIPRGAVSASSLDQLNLAITSGPYFVKERKSDGSLVLKANKQHFLYSENMPQTAIIVPTLNSGKTGLELFEVGEIDFLSNLDQTDISERLTRYQNSDVGSLHATLPVRLELLVFTERGLRLPAERRWALANKVAKYINDSYANKKGYQEAFQYFPDGGAGSLPEEKLEPIRKLRSTSVGESEEGKDIVFGTFPRNYDKLRAGLREVLPLAEVTKMALLPSYDTNKLSPKFPHLYIVSMDTGFLEDFPNITNAVKSGFLGVDRDSSEEWLSHFIKMPEDKLRLEALQQLHFESLIAPVIVPISRSPYVSLIRKPWQPGFSYLVPNCPIWQISKN